MGENFKFVLKQGIGVVPTVVVKEGEKVKRGQVIAKLDPEKLSVNLHSSVNGTVTEVTDTYVMVDATGTTGEYIKVDTSHSPAEIVREAGIIGLGGAGFPSYVKLGTKLTKEGYILCNAAECEPVLEHNMYQIRENPEKLLEGMKIAMESTGAGKGIIGIKFKHREEIKLLTKTIKDMGITDIRVLPLKNVYPVGEERALIRDTINILLDTTALPAVADCVVFNVETLYAIRDAVKDGKPLIDKLITVAGELNDFSEATEKVIDVPVGKSIGAIINSFGGTREGYGEILLGGPYTGRRGSEEDVVTKNLGGIIVTKDFDDVGTALGIIQCACGPKLDRLNEIAESMNGEVVGYEICKNAVENNGAFKCKNPGHCPGQAEKVMALKKKGARHILIGHCSDCTNTVMGSAPKLNLEVHHVTDHVMKTMDKPYIRFFDESQL